MRELLDVVHQAVELPLRVDLPFTAQGEPVESLVAVPAAEVRASLSTGITKRKIPAGFSAASSGLPPAGVLGQPHRIRAWMSH